MIVGTAVPTRVVGTTAKEMIVPTIIVGTAVPTIIVLTAYYWKSRNPMLQSKSIQDLNS